MYKYFLFVYARCKYMYVHVLTSGMLAIHRTLGTRLFALGTSTLIQAASCTHDTLTLYMYIVAGLSPRD